LSASPPPPPRRRLRRAVVILPSAFTLGNLFLGLWAIIAASRGQFVFAGWLIVLAAIADMLDGRIARFTHTGTEFGEQLDSLVDAISFGVAPSLIMYFLFFADGGQWAWILSFIYVVAAIVRLARFNVEQAGVAKMAFNGLPSPTAGVTIATYYTFTQTAFFQAYFAHWPVSQIAAWMMIFVAALMVSNVLYPVVPKFSPRTWGGRLALAIALAAVVAAFTVPEYFFFGLAAVYITYGLVRSVVMGFLERLPERDPLIDDDDDDYDEGHFIREIEYPEFMPRPQTPRGSSPRAHDQEIP
jgi:CDP-diacylglycerol---serine O-phosphatidyltransferase